MICQSFACPTFEEKPHLTSHNNQRTQNHFLISDPSLKVVAPLDLIIPSFF